MWGFPGLMATEGGSGCPEAAIALLVEGNSVKETAYELGYRQKSGYASMAKVSIIQAWHFTFTTINRPFKVHSCQPPSPSSNAPALPQQFSLSRLRSFVAWACVLLSRHSDLPASGPSALWLPRRSCRDRRRSCRVGSRWRVQAIRRGGKLVRLRVRRFVLSGRRRSGVVES